jgi:hypothetical protein
VRARADEVVTVQLLRALQALLHALETSGVALGPVLRVVAVDPASEHELSVRAFANPLGVTVRELFGLGSGTWAARGYYDANLPAVLQQASAGASHLPSAHRCSRCTNTNGRSRINFGSCSQSYLGQALLNNGACNECQLNGNHARCDLYRESFADLFAFVLRLTFEQVPLPLAPPTMGSR